MRFSVIIPLYNKARYIGATLDSVQAQTFADFEVIVVDDGSTDNSAEIVMSKGFVPSAVAIAEADSPAVAVAEAGPSAVAVPPAIPSAVAVPPAIPPAVSESGAIPPEDSPLSHGRGVGGEAFLLLRQPNGGVSAARNAGIRSARGEFIAFLDADDRWDENYLEEMNALITRHPDESLFCAARHGRLIPYQPEEAVIDDVAAWTIILWTGTIVARRTLFERVGLFREGISRGEDRDMWLRLGLAAPAVLLNRELAHYEEDADGSLTATVPLDREFPYWEWYDLPTRYPDSLRRYATNQLLQLAKAHLRAGHRRTALRLLLRCRGTSDLRARLKLLASCLL